MKQQPRNTGGTALRLLGYFRDAKGRMAVVVASILLSALAGVGASVFLRTLIDNYIAPLLLQAVPDYAGLLGAVFLMAGIYLVGVFSGLLYNRMMVSLSQGVLKQVRDEMFRKMQFLPIRYFDTHTHGEVMSHYTNDADTLRQMLAQSLPQLVSSVVTIVAVFCTMLWTSVWLSLVVVAFLFLMMKVVGRVAGKSRGYFVRQQESLGDVNGYIEEMIGGQKVVKVFCHEDKAKEGFRRKNEALRENAANANLYANLYANILMPTMMNMGYLLYVVLAVVGGAMAIGGVANLGLTGFNTLTLGAIASFLQLSRNLVNPISQISQQLNAVIMALAGAERIFALIDQEPEPDGGYVTLVNVREENGVLTETPERTGLWAWRHPHGDGTVTYTQLRGEIEFFDVDFGYSEEKLVLQNISLCARPGQKLAFVGATGAGKTTITNLINRFYDLADGKIRYDGININKIKKSDLRRSLGVVLQDVNLFTGTVMDNIRYGKLDATDQECIEAARLAGADSFIRMLPQGYHTPLDGDGGALSQGQRQLLSIARAAVADPPVMIMDEATSSIDTRTEAIVQQGMDRLMEGRTVFVIAHRLSTVQNSDTIMVLDLGCIAEQGSHSQLIAQGGQYYRLYTGAFELE